jgi:hypothetical protein
MFLRGIDKENGNYLHLPVDGGLDDQPSKTMEAFDVLQNVWVEHIKVEQEKHQAKLKSIQASRTPMRRLRR